MSSQETAGGRSSWSQTLARPESWRGAGARLAEAAVVVAALASLVVYVAPTLDAPLLEKHAFRQTQTAFTAREFHEGGLDLLHPKLPVFGEPFEVPFEFPLFQALATIPMKLGVAEDTALRATSLACFLLTALLLYGLVRYVAGPVSGVAALVAFTLTPLAVVWSRTSMIEYLATAGAVGFAWALILWRERRQHVFFVLALVAGLVGVLVKPTTALFWIIPGLAYRPSTREGARRRRFDPLTMVAIGVPLAALALWTRHADRIKAASPITEWLTSGNLRRWNHGWVRQRLDGDMWWLILERLPTVVGLFGILLLPAIVAGVRSRQRWFWLGIVSAAVLPPLVFMNLYVHHDYYLVGVSPALAALVGLGAGWLWSIVRPGFRIVAVPLAMLILAWGRSSSDAATGSGSTEATTTCRHCPSPTRSSVIREPTTSSRSLGSTGHPRCSITLTGAATWWWSIRASRRSISSIATATGTSSKRIRRTTTSRFSRAGAGLERSVRTCTRSATQRPSSPRRASSQRTRQVRWLSGLRPRAPCQELRARSLVVSRRGSRPVGVAPGSDSRTLQRRPACSLPRTSRRCLCEGQYSSLRGSRSAAPSRLHARAPPRSMSSKWSTPAPAARRSGPLSRDAPLGSTAESLPVGSR